MASKATTKTAETSAFDDWTPQAEDEAIQAIADASSIRYIIIENRFVGRFPDGRELSTPIRIGSDVLDKVFEMSEDADDRAQLSLLLELLGQKDDLEYLKSADLIAVMDYAGKYFGVFQKVLRISLGE